MNQPASSVGNREAKFDLLRLPSPGADHRIFLAGQLAFHRKASMSHLLELPRIPGVAPTNSMVVAVSMEAIVVSRVAEECLHLYGFHPLKRALSEKEDCHVNKRPREEVHCLKMDDIQRWYRVPLAAPPDIPIRSIALSSCMLSLLYGDGQLHSWDMWSRQWKIFPVQCQSISYSGHGPILHFLDRGSVQWRKKSRD